MTDQKVDAPEGGVKEAVGGVTHDEEPRKTGSVDQPASSIREKVEHAMEAVRGRFSAGAKK
jgi:uncharacterized protein YjbJ (UPF0337 family)